MKKSRLSFRSGIRLAVRRSLSAGGGMQFIMPAALFLVSWLLLGGIIALLLGTHAVPGSVFAGFRSDLADKGPLGLAFYHLFTAGGADVISSGPGWIVTIIGLVLTALLTSIFTNYFFEAANDYKEGRSDFKLFDHIAVFGCTPTVPALIRNMLEGEYSACLFLVLTSGSAQEARTRMSAVLSRAQMKRVIIIRGDIDSPEAVKRMQVSRAMEIVIPGDGRGDGQALDCTRLVASMIPSGCRPPCYVQFESRTASSVFRLADIEQTIGGKLGFVPFDSYELWAHKVFVNKSLHPSAEGYLPLEGPSGITADSPDHVHLLVAGMTPAGIALALAAMRIAHYPNVAGHPERRTRISFVGSGIGLPMSRFQAEFPALFTLARWRCCKDAMSEWQLPQGTEHLGGDFLDFEIEFIDSDVSGPMVRNYLSELAADTHTRLTVALCQEQPAEALELAVTLPEEVHAAAVQVLVYQAESGTLANALSSGSTVSLHPLQGLKPFGMQTDDFDLSLLKDLMRDAASLHIDTSSGGMASKSSASQLWSDIYNACHRWTKVRSAGEDADGVRDAMAVTEHNRWNAEQLLMKFRPLTEAEQQMVLAGGSERKAALKRSRRAHLDICSWDRLREIDPDVIQYDYDMVDAALGFPGEALQDVVDDGGDL